VLLPTVYEGSIAYPQPSPGPVVTIGNFDGVHLGHRTLVSRARVVADQQGARVCAFTFHPAPRDVLRPDNGILRIQTLDARLRGLRAAGADEVVVEPFTRELGARSAEWFAKEVLGRRLGARHVVVGWDFRFGKGRGGRGADLSRWVGVPVDQLAALEHDGVVVSSSRIREALGRGDVHVASRFLGRPHVVEGVVVHGAHRGRMLGFPTANVEPTTPLVPANGVYAVRVDRGDGQLVAGVCNVGVRPTFGPSGRSVEVHVLDLSDDLYGRTLRVHFVARVRDERRFTGSAELVTQIELDVAQTRALLASSS
jgi:riboflavin kinase/FMN adenylyltransferase